MSGVVGPSSRAGGIVNLSTGRFTENSDARAWGSLDRARNQWVPVTATLIAPDGNSIASIAAVEGSKSAITRTDLRSGVTHALIPFSLATGYGQSYSTDVELVSYTTGGIYFNADDPSDATDPTRSAFDLMVVDPATGDYHRVVKHPPGQVDVVEGGSAWAAGYPSGDDGSNTIWKINASSGSTAEYFHQAGLFVVPIRALPDGTLFVHAEPGGGGNSRRSVFLGAITPNGMHRLGSTYRGPVPPSAVIDDVAIDNGVAWTLLPQPGGGLRVSRYEHGTLRDMGIIPTEIATNAGTMWVARIESGCGAGVTRLASPPSPAAVTGVCSAAPLSWRAPDGRGCAG